MGGEMAKTAALTAAKRAATLGKMLPILLERIKEADIVRWEQHLREGLSGLALEFGAETPERRRNLARDLAACRFLYQTLQSKVDEVKGVRTESEALKELLAFADSVLKGIDFAERIAAYADTLPGVLAIEVILAQWSDTVDGPSGVKYGTKQVVAAAADVLNRAKVDILLGGTPSGLLDQIVDELSVRHERLLQDLFDEGEKLPSTPKMEGLAGIKYGPIVVMGAVVEVLRSRDKDRKIDGILRQMRDQIRGWLGAHRSPTLATLPDFAFAWAGIQLIEGWRPRVRHGTTGKPTRVATVSGNSNGYLARLLRDIAEADSPDGDGVTVQRFSSAVKSVTAAHKLQIAGKTSVFHGRDKLTKAWRSTRFATIEEYYAAMAPDLAFLDEAADDAFASPRPIPPSGVGTKR